MKISKDLLFGIVAVQMAIIVVLVVKVYDKPQKEVIFNDSNSKEIEQIYRDSINSIQLRVDSVLALNDSLNNQKEKVKYVYIEKIRVVDNNTINGNDSLLRATLNLGK